MAILPADCMAILPADCPLHEAEEGQRQGKVQHQGR